MGKGRMVAAWLLLVVGACGMAVAGQGPRVSLRSGSMAGPGDVSGLAPGLRLSEEEAAAGGPVLMAFEGRLTPEIRAAAEARGIRLAIPLGGGGFIAWLPPGGLGRTAGLPGLAWAAPMHPGLRIAPEVAAIEAGDPRPVIPLTLHVFAGADLADLRLRLEALGLKVSASRPGRLAGGGPFRHGEAGPAQQSGGHAEGRLGERCGRLVLLATPARVVATRAEIARWPETVWIGRRPAYRLLNDASAWVGQSGLDGGQTTPIHDHGILGQGQVVGVLDTGIDADMCFFRDGALGLPPTHVGLAGSGTPDPNQRKVLIVDFLWDQDDPSVATDWDSQNHGTHVAGSVAGDDLATVGERDHADGMAPRAKLVIQDGGYQVDDCADLPALGCPVADLIPFFQQAYDQGARLHTNSWGDRENFTPQNIYSDGSEDADEFMWTHPDFLLLFAAGNSGPGANTVGSPATAKNVVAVGATAHGSSAGSIASFSSRGKTEDGRIKPEVTIPGSSVVSAGNDGNVETDNCGTRSMSGTSMASPTAAGLAALVREYFEEGFYPEGAATPDDGFVPSAALVKATLIASATPMENVSEPPPSDTQGWGRILLDDALYFPGDSRRLQVIDETTGFTASGEESEEQWIEVKGSEVPLKVVLTWTDYPSFPAAATNLINDLDLVVTDPDGVVYRGNNFSDGLTPPGGAADRLNNVEVVKVASPATGFWSMKVVAHDVQQPSQGYALVATGILGEPRAPDAGRTSFDDTLYGCDDSLGLRVIDGNVGAPTVTVQVWSETETEGETVTLEQTQEGSGRYTGQIPTTAGPAVTGDGLLSVSGGDELTIEYADGDDGQGGSPTVFDTAVADCRGPAITGLRVEQITDQRMTVRFETSEPGTTVVEWGPTPDLGNTASSGILKTSHQMVINQLTTCEDYYLRVESTDRFGNSASADRGGTPHTLQSGLIPGLYWQETFEGDVSGWTLEGEWEAAAPQGLGNAAPPRHPDPAGAFNNQRALGNDLSGQGLYPGDYEPGATESARSPAQDASGWSNTELIFTKSLNVAAGDNVSVSVFTAGSTPLYGNDGNPVWDEAYERWRFDVADVVDGRPAAGVVFGLVADGQDQAAGWTIDDVIFKDGTLPDYGSCGGCTLAPSFAGAAGAADNDACAASGVTVSWEPAASWGSGGGGSYAVYRDTVPDFVPGADNRIAAGVTETSFDDAAAPTDQRLYYLVRAENDEGCGGGSQNGGLEDDNQVHAAVDETTSVSLPEATDTLRLRLGGRVHVRLEWAATAGADEYRVYRSASPEPGSFELLDETGGLDDLDLGAAVDGNTWFYLLRGVNACGQEGP